MSKETPWNDVDKESGAWKRTDRTFRDRVTADGSSGFKAEPNRYHLYVSYACPWAHRTLIVRKLKGLEDVISYDVVDWLLVRSKSWSLEGKDPGSTGDTINGFKSLKELYLSVDPNYSKTFTVPVLWDKKQKTIVNNESSEIIRMLSSEFNEFAKNKELDLYPSDLRNKIDEINAWVYPNINDGVYRCGFAAKQSAYDQAVKALFEHLDKVEEILKTNRYLLGDTFTEADVRLFTTLVRFDAVYLTHFKCNKKRLTEYPNIMEYAREIYQMNGVAETVNMEHIKHHYFLSHTHINPYSIIPVGLDVDFTKPHNRGHLSKKE